MEGKGKQSIGQAEDDVYMAYTPIPAEEDVTRFNLADRNRATYFPGSYPLVTNPDGEQSVLRHNRRDKTLLKSKPADTNLSRWIGGVTGRVARLCDLDYNWWYRGKEESLKWYPQDHWQVSSRSRFILQGLFVIAHRRRTERRPYGRLCLSNIGLRWIPDTRRTHSWESDVEVFLIENEAGAGYDDIADIHNIIRAMFEYKDRQGRVYLLSYLTPWLDLFSNFDANFDRIRNHPVMWQSQSRANFLLRVWKKYDSDRVSGAKGFRTAVEGAMVLVLESHTNGWERRLLPGSPFKTYYDMRPIPYEGDTTDMLEFARGSIVHMNDVDDNHVHKYVGDGEEFKPYLQEKFIEMELGRMFPTLIHELAWALRDYPEIFDGLR